MGSHGRARPNHPNTHCTTNHHNNMADPLRKKILHELAAGRSKAEIWQALGPEANSRRLLFLLNNMAQPARHNKLRLLVFLLIIILFVIAAALYLLLFPKGDHFHPPGQGKK